MTADDYFAIQNLVYRYCDRLDRGDLEGMSQLFASADVYLQAESGPIRDPKRILDLYRAYTRIYPDSGTPKTRHVTTNLMIEPEGDSAARAQSYVIVFQATDAFKLQPVVGGRNLDRFIKVDGQWRFRERRIETDLFGDLSAHMLLPLGPSAT